MARPEASLERGGCSPETFWACATALAGTEGKQVETGRASCLSSKFDGKSDLTVAGGQVMNVMTAITYAIRNQVPSSADRSDARIPLR